MVKISFCVTYYNQQEFVKESIESILNQKGNFDFEILVGDDGSTDNTINEVKRYQEQYQKEIKYFVMPRDNNKKYNPIHRASANRLNLVANATGDYIMFLDGDDFYCNDNFLDKAITLCSNNKEIIGIMHDFEYRYENRVNLYNQKLKEGIVDTKYFIKKLYCHAGAILFRNIFDKNRIKQLNQSKNFDDNLITLYMLNFGNLYYIPTQIYSYRQTENSIWNKANKDEQNLLNAMDYEIISRVVPEYKHYIFKRQKGAIKYIYKNRNRLMNLLGEEKFNKYEQENIKLNNQFIVNLLNWQKLKKKDRLKTILEYKKELIISKII